MLKFFVFILMWFSFLEAKEVSWHDLGSLKEGEEITIRGFLAFNKEGNPILSAQPNLKSCCVSTCPHINLDANIGSFPPYQVVMVKGIFTSDCILKNTTLIE